MATAKLVLRKEVLADGTSPLAIRITKDRKSSYKYTGKSIHSIQWDEVNRRVRKSHINSTRLNNFLLQKLAEVTDTLLTVELKKNLSAQQINLAIHPEKKRVTLFSVADEFIENFKVAGKYNRFKPDGSRIEILKEFLDYRDISFEDITVSFLKRYIAYLKGKLQNSERTIVNHLILIRSLYNSAIKLQPTLKESYPFGKDKIQIKIPKSNKIGLVVDEVKKLEEYNPTIGTPLRHAKNVWLMSFYFAGVRASDLLRLKWSDFQDDRLYYKMGKNSKSDSLTVSEKVKQILSEYLDQKTSNDDFVFPELKKIDDANDTYIVERRIAHSIHRLNKYLGKISEQLGIEKKFTTHIARHSFGNISGDKISPQMLQKLYRHSSITTTIGYQANFIHKDTDDALVSVLQY